MKIQSDIDHQFIKIKYRIKVTIYLLFINRVQVKVLRFGTPMAQIQIRALF